MAEIKAIETYYNGYRFRSRLEARWAVFFDALGVKYEYEPEGFKLPSGRMYLPDFKVKCWGKRGEITNNPFDLYIEVKGYMSKEDGEKIKEFADVKDFKASNPILVVSGIPCDDFFGLGEDLGCNDYMDDSEIAPFNYELIDGDFFGAYPSAHKGKFYLWGRDVSYIGDYDETMKAYSKARTARFEYGETPSIFGIGTKLNFEDLLNFTDKKFNWGNTNPNNFIEAKTGVILDIVKPNTEIPTARILLSNWLVRSITLERMEALKGYIKIIGKIDLPAVFNELFHEDIEAKRQELKKWLPPWEYAKKKQEDERRREEEKAARRIREAIKEREAQGREAKKKCVKMALEEAALRDSDEWIDIAKVIMEG